MARKGSGSKKIGRPPGGVDGTRVKDYPQVGIRVPHEVFSKLKALERKTKLSRPRLFAEAIRDYEAFLSSKK